MLREIFGQPRRRDVGVMQEANLAIVYFQQQVRKQMDENPRLCSTYTRWELWTKGFTMALNELEQSQFCAVQYRKQVTKPYMEAMEQRELDHYYRHLYYFKNGFIRVFSLLDKLGHFMNDYFGLHTERVKQRYSYFTVIRRMYETRKEPRLERQLFELKESYQEALNSLRQKRNMEIHLLNTEMLDDMQRTHLCSWDRTYVENLDANLADLEQCFIMVCKSMSLVFDYTGKTIRGRK